jgi:hypothetical protein
MTLKVSSATRRSTQGHVLVMVLVVVIICAIALVSYLTLVNSQNRAVARSQGWNSTVPVMEAGVEEALAHLNANIDTGLGVDGWVRIGDYYRMERAAGDSYYVVTITVTNPILPLIESRGFTRMPILVQNANSSFFLATVGMSYNRPRDGYIGRGVRIIARKNGSLGNAMLSKGRIDIGGTVRVDSYNSCDSSLSTGGLYDPTKSDDEGDISSNGQFVNAISAGGDVEIKGHISTGPGGTIGTTGHNVSIGSEDWVDAERTGIEGGWDRNDMNANIPDSPIPPPGGLPLSSGGWVGGVYYDYILTSGAGQTVYQVPGDLQMTGQKILVTGNVVLKVAGDVRMTSSSAIEIATTGMLQMFVSGRDASIGGDGIINRTKDPLRFTYYGAPTNTRVDLGGTAAFYGTVYAPYADLFLAGGALIYGGIVAKSIKATGGFTLHYDACLAKEGQGRYIVTSWDEMLPTDVARVP